MIHQNIKKCSHTFQEFKEALNNIDSSKNDKDALFYWNTKDDKIYNILQQYFSPYIKLFEISNSALYNHNNTSNIEIDYCASSDISQNECDILETNYMTVGGISAIWIAYLQSHLYKRGVLTQKPIYLKSPEFKSSAYFGSSLQYHVSHATPMYTDKEFSSRKILLASLKRSLFKKANNPNQDNYMVSDIAFPLLFSKENIKISVGYLFNEVKYKICNILKRDSIINDTIPLAIFSGKIMDLCANMIEEPLLFRHNTIRLAYNTAETKEMQDLSMLLQGYQVDCDSCHSDDILPLGISAKLGDGGSIWSVKGDGNVNPHLSDILLNEFSKNGGIILNGKLEKIIYKNNSNVLSGIVYKEHESQSSIFIKSDNLFCSLGAKAKFKYNANTKRKIKQVEEIIPGTGCSAFLLIDKKLSVPVDSNNSHFTPMQSIYCDKSKKTFTLVKSSVGAAIGSYNFNPNHAINNLFYACNIVFPDATVEIISARSCSRPINTMNSVKLNKISPGVTIATGWGGKGVTEAAGIAMQYVGESFFNIKKSYAVKDYKKILQ